MVVSVVLETIIKHIHNSYSDHNTHSVLVTTTHLLLLCVLDMKKKTKMCLKRFKLFSSHFYMQHCCVKNCMCKILTNEKPIDDDHENEGILKEELCVNISELGLV